MSTPTPNPATPSSVDAESRKRKRDRNLGLKHMLSEGKFMVQEDGARWPRNLTECEVSQMLEWYAAFQKPPQASEEANHAYRACAEIMDLLRDKIQRVTR